MWGEELYLDATGVEANASIDSTRSRSLVEGRLEEHLAAAFPEELARKNALGHRWIAGAGRQERESVRWGYERMADLRVSTMDPGASPTNRLMKCATHGCH